MGTGWIFERSGCVFGRKSVNITLQPWSFGLGCMDAAKPMPHPRLTRPNMATHEGHYCSRVGAAPSFFFFFPQLALTRLKLGPNHTKSGWFALTRAVSAISGETTEKANSGIQKKKKKGCKTHRLNWITNPEGPKLFHAFSLHSNFSSLSFVSLCCVLSISLCCVLFASLSLRHSATQSHTQSHSQLTQSHFQLTHNLTDPLLISSLNSQARPTLKILNSGIKLKLSILVFQFFLSSSWSDFFSLKLTSPDLIFFFFFFLYKL